MIQIYVAITIKKYFNVKNKSVLIKLNFFNNN